MIAREHGLDFQIRKEIVLLGITSSSSNWSLTGSFSLSDMFVVYEKREREKRVEKNCILKQKKNCSCACVLCDGIVYVTF